MLSKLSGNSSRGISESSGLQIGHKKHGKVGPNSYKEINIKKIQYHEKKSKRQVNKCDGKSNKEFGICVSSTRSLRTTLMNIAQNIHC
jgi:hypothetical protein